MLTFDNIDVLVAPVLDLFNEFISSVMNDIVRRLVSLDYATPTAAWQVQRLVESGLTYEEILEKLVKFVPKSKDMLKVMFEKAGVKAIEFDDLVYKAAGLKPLPLNLSPAMVDVLGIGLQKTQGLFVNLTNTTALSGSNAFVQAADLAYMQISTGAFDYGSAIKQAITRLAKDGLTTVTYTKRRDKLEVAMRRTVLTGIGQTAGQLQMTRALEMEAKHIQVSAHIGARDQGEGPQNHESWQGKVYSLFGDDRYPDFIETTGYGTGEGLLGWNCRHHFYPFFVGISENVYDAKNLREMADATVVYNGEKLSIYEASQKQRAIERSIRKAKREAKFLEIAKLDNTKQITEIRELQARMRDFIKQTDLNRQYGREQIPGSRVKKVVVTPEVRFDMRTAKYTVSSTSRGSGYFESKWVVFDDGTEAIMKPDPVQYFAREIDNTTCSEREALAYDMDQILGTNLVPETVYRKDVNASFQKYISNAPTGIYATHKVKNPEDWGLMALLDMVLGNEDRHYGNLLVKNGKLYAIDHGLILPDVDDIQIPFDEVFSKVSRSLLPPLRVTLAQLPLDIAFKRRLQNLLPSTQLQKFGEGVITYEEWQSLKSRIQRIIDNWDEFFY